MWLQRKAMGSIPTHSGAWEKEAGQEFKDTLSHTFEFKTSWGYM